MGYARSLPYRRHVLPASVETPKSSFPDEENNTVKKKVIRPKKRQPQKVAESKTTEPLASGSSPSNLPYELAPAISTTTSRNVEAKAIEAAAAAIAGIIKAPSLSPTTTKLSALMDEMKLSEEEKTKKLQSDEKPVKKESLFKKKKAKTATKLPKNAISSPVSLNVSERVAVGLPKPMGVRDDFRDAGSVEGYVPVTVAPPLRSLFPSAEVGVTPLVWPWGAPMNDQAPVSQCQPCAPEIIPAGEPVKDGTFEADLEFKVLTPAQIKEMTAGGTDIETAVAELQKEQPLSATSQSPSISMNAEDDCESMNEEEYYDEEDEDDDWDTWEENISTYMKCLDLLEGWRTGQADAFAEYLATQRLMPELPITPYLGVPTSSKVKVTEMAKLAHEVERKDCLLGLLVKEKNWLEETLGSESLDLAMENVKFMISLFCYVSPFPFPLNKAADINTTDITPTPVAISTDEGVKFWRCILLVLFAVVWPPSDKKVNLSSISRTGTPVCQFGDFLDKAGSEQGVDRAEFNALCYLFVENLKLPVNSIEAVSDRI